MATPQTYHEQPRTVEALQYDGTNGQQIADWANERIILLPDGSLVYQPVMPPLPPGPPGGAAPTPISIPINVTDWVMTDPWGNWTAMNDANFQLTYDPALSQSRIGRCVK